jgi:hypothetical protein
MSYRIHHSALCLLAVSASLSGCSSTTPQSDRMFGHAVRAALASQTLDPNAARNSDPVYGMDGRSALAAQQQYTLGFSKPAQAPAPMTSRSAK